MRLDELFREYGDSSGTQRAGLHLLIMANSTSIDYGSLGLGVGKWDILPLANFLEFTKA